MKKSFSIVLIIIFTFIFLNKNIILGNFNNEPETWKIYSEKIENLLTEGKVINVKNMREYLLETGKESDFCGQVFVVILDNGLKCVFKCEKDDDELKSEVLAWKISKEFNLGNVVPVVYREINLGNGKLEKGFLSLFAESDDDLLKYSEEEFYNFLNNLDKNEVIDYKIFNFLFGNFDVGAHNLLTCNRKLIMIDNEGIVNTQCVKYGDVPFIKFYQFNRSSKFPVLNYTFPFELARFADLVSRTEIKNKYNYNPTRYMHNFIIFDNSYWVQFIEENHAKRIKNLIYTDCLPEEIKLKLNNITREKLQEIFKIKNKRVENLILGILERKEMLIKKFEI